MADCFSLPNAAELVEQHVDELVHELLAEAKRTAETINELRKENAKLKAERDAAMKELPHDCNSCSKDCDITIAHKALLTKRCNKWEWRGVSQCDNFNW